MIYMFLENKIFSTIYEMDKNNLPIFKNYLAGKWVMGEDFIDLKSPIDGSLIAKISRVSNTQMEDTLNLVYQKGRSAIRGTSGNERMHIFLRTAESLANAKKDFMNVLVQGGGKPQNNAMGEIQATIDRLEKTTMEFGYILGHYIPGDWDEETLGSEAIVKREPLGILFAISSFNYPLFISMTKIIPALLLGNAIILKPASAVPLSAIMMARLFEEAKLPKECFSVISMRGKDVNAFLQDKRIHAISFTGSTETGLKILQNSGIKQFHLELGGKDPAIVLNDSELKSTVDKVVKGVVSNAGQRCDAIRLIIVESGIYDQFKSELMAQLRTIEPRNPIKDEKTIMGPLIDDNAADIIESMYKDAIEHGGNPLIPFHREKNYVWPCLVEVTPEKVKDLVCYKEDVFGPFALLIPVNDDEQALEVANGTMFGLDACIFGTDEVRMRIIARKLEVGAVFINESPKHGIGYYPFGGMKDSGIGREGIGFSVHQLTTIKSIVYSYKGKRVWEFDY